MDWVLTHIKDSQGTISFSVLENDLAQPFGELPASCSAVEDEVRQVRLVVETLWRFTGMREQEDLAMPATFRNAYRHLRSQLYIAILTHLGVSFKQLRKATLNADGDSPTAELIASQRDAVADILGIDESRLSALFFNVEQSSISVGEDLLERLFGYQDTLRDPFENGSLPGLIS